MTDEIGDLPLGRHSGDAAVGDLQRRLRGAGHDPVGCQPGSYDEATEAAVASFQEDRGLHADGACGHQTWSALVEAGYRLGDRLLYQRTPMLRGDGVGELQLRLGALGFDTGRVDAIFGPDTARALADFQRNAGLTTDGICGPDTLAALRRLSSAERPAPSVAGVREREAFRLARRPLAERRVAVGETGGLEALAGALARALSDAGATVVVLHHPDGSAQARSTNRFRADAYLGLVLLDGPGCQAAHYATTGFESAGGRRLAELVVEELTPVTGPGPVRAMRVPVLRETRPPAVICSIGPPEHIVRHSATIATTLTHALARWAVASVEG